MKEFLVDSKQACFLCLKVGAAEDCKTSPWSISQLFRYLKFDFQKVFDVSLPLLQTAGSNLWEETDMLVTLCRDCHAVSSQFGKLFEELELIKLKINASVKTIHEVMTKAEQDECRVEEYRKVVTVTNPVELINISIAESLRKETIEKCTLKVRKADSRVSFRKEQTKSITEADVAVALNKEESSRSLKVFSGAKSGGNENPRFLSSGHDEIVLPVSDPEDNCSEEQFQFETAEEDPLGNLDMAEPMGEEMFEEKFQIGETEECPVLEAGGQSSKTAMMRRPIGVVPPSPTKSKRERKFKPRHPRLQLKATERDPATVPNSLKCKICKLVFNSTAALHQHRFKHLPDEDKKCPKCGKLYGSRKRYSEHVKECTK